MTDAKERPLTPKQKLFVSEYLKSGNATEAARKAGYKGSDRTLGQMGCENLKKPNIARAIEARQKKRDARLELEEDFELQKALKLLEMCMEPQKIYNPFTGDPVKDVDGNYVMRFDSKGANTALQTIAKLRGKFIQKVDMRVQDGVAEALEAIDA